MGVEAARVETIEGFTMILEGYVKQPGPNLIEVMI
jgi:hypothetical protein